MHSCLIQATRFSRSSPNGAYTTAFHAIHHVLRSNIVSSTLKYLNQTYPIARRGGVLYILLPHPRNWKIILGFAIYHGTQINFTSLSFPFSFSISFSFFSSFIFIEGRHVGRTLPFSIDQFSFLPRFQLTLSDIHFVVWYDNGFASATRSMPNTS